MDERREQQQWLIEAIKRIDDRTEHIDARLRDVENKINNGFTTRIAVTDENVKALIEEQKRLRDAEEKRRAQQELREKQRAVIFKAIGAMAAISGIIFGIVRLL